MIRFLSIIMLLIGVVWALVVGWAFVTLSGISVPVSTGTVVLEYGLALVGPVCLVLGPILVMTGNRPHLGAILCFLSCLVLTGIECYQFSYSLHPSPLEMRPPYLLYAILIVLVLAADVGAFRLYQLTDKKPAAGSPTSRF